MKTFSVEFVTPEKPILSDRAEFVSLPAFEGSMGVLPGHTPVVAQLVPGTVRIRKPDGEATFAVSGGFVEVRPDRVSIFAESAESAEEINAEEALQEAERARVKLAGAPRDREIDITRVEMELRAALAKLRVAQTLRRKPPTQ